MARRRQAPTTEWQRTYYRDRDLIVRDQARAYASRVIAYGVQLAGPDPTTVIDEPERTWVRKSALEHMQKVETGRVIRVNNARICSHFDASEYVGTTLVGTEEVANPIPATWDEMLSHRGEPTP